jgi:hypoxanthine phosphoribosyltransferase
MKSDAPNPTPRTLIPAAAVRRRISELAAEIDRDFADTDLLICIGVLKGSVFFMVDLL